VRSLILACLLSFALETLGCSHESNHSGLPVEKNLMGQAPLPAAFKARPIWRDDKAFLGFLVKAATDAVNILGGVGDPAFESAAIQMHPPKHVTTMLWFAPDAAYPADLRARYAQHACQVLPLADDNNVNADNTIACNPAFLRRLYMLIRLAHSNRINDFIHNDWALITLLRRLDQEPDKVFEEAAVDVSESHMQEHISFALVMLLAHEAWHIQAHDVAAFDSPDQAQSMTPKKRDLGRHVNCRNYDEFGRAQGRFVFGGKASSIDAEGTTSDPADREYVSRSRAIWKGENAADKYAAQILVRVMDALVEKGLQPNQYYLLSESVMTAGTIALLSWYGKLEEFAVQECAEFEGQDFFLTKCLCKGRKYYDRLSYLFGGTHPPMLLRMSVMIDKMIVDSLRASRKRARHEDEASKAEIERHTLAIRGWRTLLEAALDTPLKITFASCMSPFENMTPDGQLVQVFPDLAGVLGPHGSKQYVGYPEDEGTLMMECADKARGAEIQR